MNFNLYTQSMSFRPLLAREIMALPPLIRGLAGPYVRLLPRPHPLSLVSKALGRAEFIIVRGGRIFWPDLKDDLSQDRGLIALLAHELIHVWQYQNGMSAFTYLIRERGLYGYDPEYDQFNTMGYEQQAALVEDYVRLTYGLQTRHAIKPTSLTTLTSLIPPYFAL